MTNSDQIDALAAALAKAQGAMEHASKDGTNPHFKSRYATLASVWDAARLPLSANGLSVVQTAGTDGTTVSVDTLLAHSSGQWVRSSLSTQSRDAGPQAIGSCISYLRRYALSAMVGICADDDDGEAATSRGDRAAAARQVDSERETEAPREPDGVEDWWLSMISVAEGGVDALQKAWDASPKVFKGWATTQKRDAWAELKRKAGAVGSENWRDTGKAGARA